MSRQEAMEALIESGMELRRDDIQLGKKLERERIIKLLESYEGQKFMCLECSDELINLIKGEQKSQSE